MSEPDRQTGESDEQREQAARAANRFDVRRLIAALFFIYGIIVLVLGLVGSHHVKTKAAGINVDLWTGIAMLVFASLMLFWALARPTELKARTDA